MKSNQLAQQIILLFLLAAIWTLIFMVPLLFARQLDEVVAVPAVTVTPQPAPTQMPTATATPAAINIVPPVNTSSPLPTPTPPHAPRPALYTYKIINTYPHDHRAFTQGLIYIDGVLYEGTGRYGQSSLRRVDLATGQVGQFLALPPQYFGEGITMFADKIIQLTWKANTGFVYDKNSFELERQFTYPTEGWGITHDGEKLIMSDGTSTLYFWDPETFIEIGRVEVYDNNGPVVRLNELEYINGEVYANVWQTYRIVRIDPETGWVVGSIDLHGVITGEPIDVLNGIAYDADNDRLFITGKLWPKLFEIELVPVE